MKLEEKNSINHELFRNYLTDDQSPSNMYKKLIETEEVEMNKIRVVLFKKILSKLQRTVDYVSRDNTFKIEENEKIIDIVEHILELNNKIQSGQGLKILTPNQVLSR